MQKLETRYRPKRRTSGPKSLPAINENISISKAAALITERCISGGHSARRYKNNARERIKYAIDNKIISATGELLNFGEFIAWAGQKQAWKAGLAGLDGSSEPQLGSIIQGNSKFSGALFSAPGDLKACQAELYTAVSRMNQLERELARCKEFIIEYHPCIETGLKIRKIRHLRENVRKFVDELQM